MKICMTVYGLVQGVGFRYMTKHLADTLGIVGSVKNNDNGSVYIQAQGDEKIMHTFIAGIQKGPSPSCRVEHVDIEYNSSFKDYTSFNVVY